MGCASRKLSQNPNIRQRGHLLREGVIHDVNLTHDRHAYWVVWAGDTRGLRVSTDLGRDEMRPTWAILQAAGEWQLIESSYLVYPPSDGEGNKLAGPHCPRCLFPSDAVRCPICSMLPHPRSRRGN